jgi:HEAT repeat protein
MSYIMLRWSLSRIKSGKEKQCTRAAKRLGKARDARAVRPLIAMLGDESAYVRAAAALALGGICDAQAVQPLLATLNDADEAVRDAAALALGMIKDKHSGHQLVPLLRSKDSAVRVEAEEKLKALGISWL